MKAKLYYFLLLLIMACLPQLVFAQASGGAIKRPVKKPTTTTAPAKPNKPTPKPTITTNSDYSQTISFKGVSFKMIRVDGGIFTMGATSEQGYDAYSDEKPTHQVTLSTYYIGETEVTQALWEAVMGSNPSYFKGANRPVENVGWNECQTFISKLNSITGKKFRLPKEKEWEYAAKGGSRSHGYEYSGSNEINDVAWYDSNACDGVGSNSPDYGTHNVKTKKPNELGIYDMSGNVHEWCEDLYDSSGSGRVYRGGGWDDFARCCRVSYRYYFSPDLWFSNHGLRLAL